MRWRARYRVELSCKTEYALLALIELASHYQQQQPLQIRQIAAQQNIPDRYLEQLLAALRRGNLVRSQRGAKGGYLLAREPWKISLQDVLACLEGSEAGRDRPEPDAQTLEQAIVTEVWQETTAAIAQLLGKYTLQDLCDKRDAKRQLNLMYYI